MFLLTGYCVTERRWRRRLSLMIRLICNIWAITHMEGLGRAISSRRVI